MRRIKSLHEPRPLHHAGGSAAADDIDVISRGLGFSEHPSRDVLRIAAEEIDLEEGILFCKTFFKQPHDLMEDQSGIARVLPCLLWAFDEIFLRLGCIHEG